MATPLRIAISGRLATLRGSDGAEPTSQSTPQGRRIQAPALRLGILGFFACYLGASLAASPSFAETQVTERPWRVLVLQGYDPWLPATVQLEQAMRSALHAGASRVVDVYTETLDSGRFLSGELEDAFLVLVRKKYARDKPDIVLAGAPFGLDFALRHRAELWPEAPIVFFGVPQGSSASRTIPPNVTGQFIQYDAQQTLALALKLSPDARRVIIVGGVTEADQLRVQSAVDAAAQLVPNLDIVRLDQLGFSDIAQTLRKQPHDSIVMFMGFYRDARGDSYLPAIAVEKLSAASVVPIYSYSGSLLGRGIVGGALTDFEREGRQVGELAADVLNGRISASAPPRPPIAAECVVDARQMARWGLSEARLPPGCAIAFRTPGLWETYRWYVAAAVALILLQALLIAALLFQRLQRRRATLESQRMRVELSHAARLATVGELTAAISHEINQPLGAIQSNADAADMLLDVEPPRLDRVRQVLSDIRTANLRASEVIRRLRTLLQKNELAIQSVDLNEVINTVLRLVATEARRREVSLHPGLVNGPLTVDGDPIQLQQVVLNLLMNAMDALADVPSSRRQIQIRTSRSKESVCMDIADNGHGIVAEHVPLLFESFFTTKTAGLGLGLSITQSIVRAHGGHIRAANNPDGGATFVVSLPKEGTRRTRAHGHAKDPDWQSQVPITSQLANGRKSATENAK